MQERVLLLTGTPGIGKTTVLTKAVTALKASGCCVGGMISREAREGGTRGGFEILDLEQPETAHAYIKRAFREDEME